VVQRHFYREPGFTIGVRNETVRGPRPAAGSFVVRIRPGEDLLDRVPGKLLAIPLATVSVEKSCQRLAGLQTTQTLTERLIDIGPGFVDKA
jgi:hypothetical protein